MSESKHDNPYRLPTTVIPERYEIRLQPDLNTLVFLGEETIAVNVREPVREIVLNALELEIPEVALEHNGEVLPGRVELDPAAERAYLRFDKTVPVGRALLRLKFRGVLNDKLHGFYRSEYRDEQGRLHVLAATQFEATDARRAFPCWDEPALKAVFKTTLVIDEKLNAFSNTGIESERRLGNGLKEIVFKETIKMSTYLVAFIVGELEATEPVFVDGIPLRIVYPPGKKRLTRWAEQVGAFSLKFFADYYQRAYPGDKLDLIAIPDFASGAMENLGAITFRETALLVDEKQASRAELERVADVICHENAHMWFGDLVTMEWWNGLWLNEAFATFMEMLAVDAWRPEWRRWDSFSISKASAMATDGLENTRAIEFEVKSPDEARAMFDVLTYEKGAAVLRMLEQFLGPETFREGIRLYLRRHEFGNARTEDLWDALESVSRQPVRRMMDSWIFRPGLPLVRVQTASDGRGVKLSQERFLYLKDSTRSDDTSKQLWCIPIKLRLCVGENKESRSLIMDGASTYVDLPERPNWVWANEGGHGFYRVYYEPELLKAITDAIAELQPVERFTLVGDTWATVIAGLTSIGEFFRMAKKVFKDETDLNVWRALLGPLHYLDMIAPASAREALQNTVRELVSPALQRLGWSPKPGEDRLVSQLRGALIDTLGTLGDDAAVQSRALELYRQYRRGPESVHPDLVPALISVVAHIGDTTQYEEFKNNFKSASTPQEEQRYLFALADFQRLELLRKTMEMTLNGEVRTQNAPFLMYALLMNNACRYEAWEFLKNNWEKMNEKYPESAIPRMCEGVVALVDKVDDVVNFFATHKVKQAGKMIDQHLEKLRIAAMFKQREGERLAKELNAS